jgi:hypothetical protein
VTVAVRVTFLDIIPVSRQFTITMFRGILPSKRVVSSDFIMVTPIPAPISNGKEKENTPGSFPVSAVPKPSRPATKGLSKVSEKHKEKDSNLANEKSIPKAEVPMNEAFDQLLVSTLVS